MSEGETPELLPCPFCGCTTIKRREGEYPYHVCDWCGTEGPAEGRFDGVEQGWNVRAMPAADLLQAMHNYLCGEAPGITSGGQRNSELRARILAAIPTTG